MPPVNLKDRIAALQQRNASQPGTSGGEPSPVVLPGASRLKDKIANFERKGAVPTPRGRFGTGAPPSKEALPKKRGELYGNRVPELAKSTGEAALLVRKRTVSSSDPSAAAQLRSTSPDAPPVPTLTGDPSKYGSLEPRGPGVGLLATTRRAVSDVLPRRDSTLESEGTLVGSEEETAVVEKKLEVVPTVEAVAEPEKSPAAATPPDTPAGDLSPSVDAPYSSQFPAPSETESSASPDESKQFSEDAPQAHTVPASPIPMPAESAPKEPVDVGVAPAEAVVSKLESAEEPKAESPVAEAVSVATETLTVDTKAVPTPQRDPTTSPESARTAGSDNVSFATAESPVDVKVKVAEAAEPVSILATPSVTIIPDTPSITSSIATPSTSRTSVNIRQSVLSEMSVGSLALDAREAVIVSEPPQIVSPTVTRAVIVPAPAPAPTRSPIPSPPPVSATEQAVLDRREARKSFHAVVHRKVRETSPAEPLPTPAVPAPPKQTPNFPPPRTPTVQRVRADVPASPQSPGFTDLVTLMADAALLEEQLMTSPTKKPAPPPTLNIQAAIPEITEPEPEKTAVPQSSHLQPEATTPTQSQQSSPSSQSYHSAELASGPSHPVTHVRARTTPAEPTTPSKESRYFSLRGRKGSMPGAYPRNSMCSEMSTESSVFVARPPSPISGHDHPGSDASSVRSSSKSWKSPKKGIGRASSWLFRNKNRSSTVIEGTCKLRLSIDRSLIELE